LEKPPSNSHVERAHAPIYRQAYPYVHNEESGLFFCAFSRSLEEIDKALKRMAGHEAADGSLDGLFEFTKSVANNFYYCPSLSELVALRPAEDEEKLTMINASLREISNNNNNNDDEMECKIVPMPAETEETKEKKKGYKKIHIEYW
jgi:deferrochelatase/peroxidase EfeB